MNVVERFPGRLLQVERALHAIAVPEHPGPAEAKAIKPTHNGNLMRNFELLS